jgi:hypothetical protein
MSLDGDTPAYRAGIKINENNKWLTIIQNAKVTSLKKEKISRKVTIT